MSKGQRGNKEAKKPKKAPVPIVPAGSIDPASMGLTKAPPRPKR